VYLPGYLRRRKRWEPTRPTPRFFTPNVLAYDFNPRAPRPERWLRFLEEVFPGPHCPDEQAIATVQEWFGYCRTPDTSQQKILMMVGPTRCGKGTIGRVLRAMIGEEDVAGPTLASLGTNFGLMALLGKSVGIISDARLSYRTDLAQVTERLLSISGEDVLTIDRKHKSHITVRLPVRFNILTNELPHLKDTSGALAGRMLMLRFTQSFYGREDTRLTTKLIDLLHDKGRCSYDRCILTVWQLWPRSS
jgi:putative DNA primase/helicase